MKDIAKILKELRTHPAVREVTEGKTKPESTEEEIRAYAEIAAKLGYDITREDMMNYISGTGTELLKRTDESAGAIRELSEDEIGEAAGGGDHKECYDTYRDRENCWVNDGCDHIYEDYRGYLCHYGFRYQSSCKYQELPPCKHDDNQV